MSEAKTVNLTGKWKLVKIEGDIDGFFKAQGWSWMARKAASAFATSVFDKTEVITMDEKTYKCEEKGAPRDKNRVQNYTIELGSGKEVDWTDPPGGKVKLSASIEGDKLILKTTGEKYPKIITRYIKDGKMYDSCSVFIDGKKLDGDITNVFEKVE